VELKLYSFHLYTPKIFALRASVLSFYSLCISRLFFHVFTLEDFVLGLLGSFSFRAQHQLFRLNVKHFVLVLNVKTGLPPHVKTGLPHQGIVPHQGVYERVEKIVPWGWGYYWRKYGTSVEGGEGRIGDFIPHKNACVRTSKSKNTIIYPPQNC